MKNLFSILFCIAAFNAMSQSAMLVLSDRDCTVSIDGAGSEQVAANVPKKINISAGEHIVNADANVNSSKVSKSQMVTIEPDKQKIVKFDFGAAEKSEAAAAPLREYTKINPKEVLKARVILTSDLKKNNYKTENLGGVSLDLEESDSRRLVQDLNMLKAVIPGERSFNSCAVLIVYMKNGSSRVFYGNGKRFNEIVNGKPEGEYYTMTAWNIIVKHFEVKKELICDDKDF